MKGIQLLLLGVCSLIVQIQPARTQCPNYSPVNYFDTSCYKKLPSDLKVGQGRLGHGDLWSTTGARAFDFYIPNGREGWAIAVVHQWQVLRNILKYDKDPFNWHTYFGTLMKESFGACDPNLNFTGITRCSGAPLVQPFTALDNYYINIGTGSVARKDGCFQIDGATGWPIYPKYYPWRWTNASQHTTYMAEANFETAAHAKMYYELAYLRMMEYVKGFAVNDVFSNALDPSGGSMLVAMAYNKGFNGTPENIFTTPANVAAAKASSDWVTLGVDVPDLTYDYTRAVIHVSKVLSNNYEGGWTRTWSGTGWTNTAENQWHCWYDKPISWAMMTSYMNKFFPLYPEVNAATVTSKVKTVFDAINGGGPVSFRFQLAPVLDAFILNMPYDDPMQAWLYSTDGISGCHKAPGNCIGPAVTLKPKGPLTFCNGLYVDLETVAGTGFTYQWYRNGSLVANTYSIPNIFRATQSGTYSVKVTNNTGCTIESDCDITVTVNNCSTCDLSAIASSTNNACSGVQNGSVNVALSGTGYPYPVTYNWTGPVSGNTASMSNVPDGTYVVEVTKVGDPGCKAYATTAIFPATVLDQKINLVSTIVNCSTVDLAATVVANPPAACTYKLKVMFNTPASCYGTWDNSQLRVMAFANGLNMNVPNPAGNGSGNCTHLDYNFTVPHNVSLTIDLLRIPTWTVSGANFSIQLFNPQGTQILNYNINGVNFTQYMTNLYTGTSNCNTTPLNYIMSWSPLTELNVLTNVVNSTTAQAAVSADRTYTVTAQHPTIPACSMSRSYLVDYTCPGGLPVTWMAFAASREETGVVLNWTTAQEEKAHRYRIERSLNGKDFESIGFVMALNKSTSTQLYTFRDGLAPGTIVYYRIVLEDLDGTNHYSEIRKVDELGKKAYAVYPNPSYGALYILPQGGESLPLNWAILDMSGKSLKQGATLESGAGTPVEISLADFAPGLYVLRFGDGVSQEVVKVIKQ